MVLLDTGTPGTSREIYSEDAEGEARTRNPWITNLNNSFVSCRINSIFAMEVLWDDRHQPHTSLL